MPEVYQTALGLQFLFILIPQHSIPNHGWHRGPRVSALRFPLVTTLRHGYHLSTLSFDRRQAFHVQSLHLNLPFADHTPLSAISAYL